MIGMFTTPTRASTAPALSARRGSSIAAWSAMKPKYRNSRISSEVSRASHTHQVPQVGFPERAGPEREKRKQRAGGRDRARHHARESGVEREPQSRPERHHQIKEHRHPGRRDVDEDDAISLALLGVGGGAEKTDVQ